MVLGTEQQGNAGMHRSWYFACHEENINPKQPARLPLLFALDTKLNIPNGFVYLADCSGVQRQGDPASGTYCAADFGDSSGCGGGSGSGSSDGGGDSGCGGGGCGGGD